MAGAACLPAMEPLPLEAEPSEHSRDRHSGGCLAGPWQVPATTTLSGRVVLGFVTPACSCPSGTFVTLFTFSPWSNCDRSQSPASLCPFAMHHASWVLFPLTGATRDGCFLGKTNVCDHCICATHPKDAPVIGQLGRASNCLPLGSPTVVRGLLGWCPAAPMALVLPPALGVPLPQCLLGVPSPRTPPPASGSDLTGPEHLPFLSAVTMLSCPHLSFAHPSTPRLL